MTILGASSKLVAQLNARIPRGMRGVHSVWIRTDTVEGEFVQRICVALNPNAMPRVLASLPAIPASIDGFPVVRVDWPSGPDAETIHAYEDGSRPQTWNTSSNEAAPNRPPEVGFSR